MNSFPESNSQSPAFAQMGEMRDEMLEQLGLRLEKAVTMEKTVYKIANLASTAYQMDAFYSQLHQLLAGITSVDQMLVVLRRKGGTVYEYPYFGKAKLQSEAIVAAHQFDKKTLSSLVFEKESPIQINGVALEKFLESRNRELECDSLPQDWIGIPLTRQNGIIGALIIQSNQPGFRYRDLEKTLLIHSAQHVTNAIRRQEYTNRLRVAHEKLRLKNRELETSGAKIVRSNDELKQLLSERAEIEKQLAHTATHDALTGLPNRPFLLTRLRQVIDQAHSDADSQFAVLFLDLDRFKVVNDSLGHLVGDALLREVAARLRTCVRPNDVVARLGGDEFCVLLVSGATDDVINRVATRILENLVRPVNLGNQRVVTSASIGITRSCLGYTSAEDMLRDADTALYQVKSNGKSDFQIFDQSMREKAIGRMEMEQALRLAIEENDISVHYQPVIDLKNGKIVSFEALARWTHPKLGAIPASRFIPIAEEVHLIPQLTAQVFRKAAKQICQWRKEITGMENLSLNVNISSGQIESGDCIEMVKRILERECLPPENLKLEVTESLLLNSVEKATEALNDLNDMNVKLALDDFGTGYSSLSCLNSLPLHELKIDLSFVRNIVTEPRNHAIVQMIVALADVMNLQVVAEGVENESQLRILRDLKVHYAQGYLFGEPASATSVTKSLVQITSGFSGVFSTYDKIDPSATSSAVDSPLS